MTQTLIKNLADALQQLLTGNEISPGEFPEGHASVAAARAYLAAPERDYDALQADMEDAKRMLAEQARQILALKPENLRLRGNATLLAASKAAVSEQPEPVEQEPVATVYSINDLGGTFDWTSPPNYRPPVGTKLYTRPVEFHTDDANHDKPTSTP